MAIQRFALLALGATVFLSSTLHAAEWHKSWQVSGKPELRVFTQDASIELEVGSSDQIEAEVKTRGYAIGGDGIKITEHQEGNRVELEIREPSGFFSFGNRSIHLALRVPRDLTADLHSGDGSVRLAGLRGSLRISTGDGSIEGHDLDGDFDARSGDGSLRAEGRFDRLQVRTTDGSVNVRAVSGSRMSSTWRLETGDGSVHLELPRDLGANLQLRSGDGSIHVDLPLTMQGTKGEHAVEGKLNGGGPFLEVHTGDGSIVVGAS